MKIQIKNKEPEEISVKEAAFIVRNANCTLYDGGRHKQRNAYAISHSKGLITLFFDNEVECREFETKLKETMKNVLSRTYPVTLKSVRVYEDDLQRLSALKTEESSYPQIIHMLIDFYESSQS